MVVLGAFFIFNLFHSSSISFACFCGFAFEVIFSVFPEPSWLSEGKVVALCFLQRILDLNWRFSFSQQMSWFLKEGERKVGCEE